ncbi:MAG: hypothetical protein WCP04_09030 [Pseudomonadota bacterium]
MKLDDKPRASLEDALARLPQEIVPTHDLWPRIEAALHDEMSARPPASRVVFGLVAGCLLGAVAMSVLWGVRAPGTSGLLARDAASVMAARSQLATTYRTRLPLLDAPTRVRVERALGVIQAAEQDLAQSRRAAPDSAVLSRLYASTTRQEFDLYDAIVRATEPFVRRTST